MNTKSRLLLTLLAVTAQASALHAQIAEYSRELDAFTRIEVSGDFRIEISEQPGYSVAVSVDDALRNYVQSYVDGDVLKIYLDIFHPCFFCSTIINLYRMFQFYAMFGNKSKSIKGGHPSTFVIGNAASDKKTIFQYTFIWLMFPSCTFRDNIHMIEDPNLLAAIVSVTN